MNRLLAFAVGALALAGTACFQPVVEQQCSATKPCGSGWRCVQGECQPPSSGTGTGTGGGVGSTGGSGGTSGGGQGGGGVGGSGGAGGGGVAGCGGQTCKGCCDGAGQCQGGTTPQACGVSGLRCETCGLGSTCNGKCLPATPCDRNCAGCCAGGVCVPTSVQTALNCGAGAQACTTCATGQQCDQGKCVTASCGPQTCTGCCFNGSCIGVGMQPPGACGSSGGACVSCAMGQACQGGQCVKRCDATTCNGCCDAQGVCQSETNATCGVRGQACNPCPMGLTCDANLGLCRGTACASVCKGCCNTDLCLNPPPPSACFTPGGSCTFCNGNSMCVNGACMASNGTVGTACTQDSQCTGLGGNAQCRHQTADGGAQYPGGFCTRTCTSSGQCGGGGQCAGLQGTLGETGNLCLPFCQNGSCRSGYVCYQQGNSGGVCWLPINVGTADAGTAP